MAGAARIRCWSCVELEKTYGRQRIFENIDLIIWHGERVGLIGANGAGKSVLLRLILGNEAPDLGEIRLGPSVTVGLLRSRTRNAGLQPDVDRCRAPAASLSESSAVAFLLRYLFPYQQVTQRIGDFSGGERSRLQLALLVLSGANFLLLDEPTNNLDIASAEVLEAPWRILSAQCWSSLTTAIS